MRLIVICLGYLSILSAQYPGLVSLAGNLPVWSTQIKRAADLRGQYIYRDKETAELVIAFPVDQDNPDSALKIYRYLPQNQVRGFLTVSINRTSQGRFHYQYTLANRKGAKEEIEVWFLVGPDSSAEVEADPSNWGFLRIRNMSESAVASLLPGNWLYWSVGGVRRMMIPAGGSPKEFGLTSNFLPGLASAYVQGGEPMSSDGDLPSEVEEQLAPLLTKEQDNQVILTICPKFDPGLDKAVIAKTWQRQIQEVRDVLDTEEKGFYEHVSSIARACADAKGICLTAEAKAFLKSPRQGMSSEIAKAFLITFN